ncbi:acetyltransferase (GNAT) family protein [Micromonospora kangleipakensis]|uniref:Acetyltransferase (GNAT) family protein n=1 Tax=Micromonospora kangleipakensis TaxID=1077942 RepID=A0A4Q8B4H4_9ACTN|nr:GNAT family N-acetyltransferase [Micromonospora kangleipakensis]RZU72464.1 acetyltransferase (GNAT) family protein [Micromonospora kangleipakensis]
MAPALGAGAIVVGAGHLRQGWLRTRMAGPWRVWLAEVGDQPCGHVFVCLVDKVPSPYPGSEALGYVTNFYVTPEQRNRGLGRALLDEVTRYARAHRLDTLIVWPSERSAPLYRRCGFDGPGELLEQPVASS